MQVWCYSPVLSSMLVPGFARLLCREMNVSLSPAYSYRLVLVAPNISFYSLPPSRSLRIWLFLYRRITI